MAFRRHVRLISDSHAASRVAFLAIIRPMTLPEAIERVVERKSLREEEARSVMAQIMDGEATPSQIAGLLVGLRMKGETPAELTGFAREMRARVTRVPHSRTNVVDTCGTGGDKVKTFNLSTGAAVVASAAGACIAKHGNRAFTSKCGSADVLESLGVNLTLDAESAARVLDEIGLVFLFAPNYHPAMKYAAGPRKEMAIRTLFNLLGPLTNPAGAERQLIGVFAPTLTLKIAQVLKRLGCRRAVIAHGVLGLDEVSPVGTTQLAIVDGRNVEQRFVRASDFDVAEPNLDDISAGASVQANADKLMEGLTKVESPEARSLIPGASIALWLGEVASDFRTGAQLAKEAIASGAARRKLEQLIATTGGAT